MTRPRLLDLFCCGGGSAMGYHRAGFDVVGVDIKPQPHYPFEFHQADALTFPTAGFDAINASPPCQAHTSLRHLNGKRKYPELVPATRARLMASGLPYVMENVIGAPMGDSGFLIMLCGMCGTMFGLATPDGRAEIRRHRLFEMSFSIALRPACQHGKVTLCAVGDHPHSAGVRHQERKRRACDRKVLTVTGHTPVDNTYRAKARRAMSVTGNTPQTNTVRNTVRETFTVDDARAAMGIDWLPMKALSQAIPPAYTEFIGRHLRAVVDAQDKEDVPA